MPLEAPLPGLLWVRAQGSGGGPGGEGGGGAKAEGGGRGLVQGTPEARLLMRPVGTSALPWPLPLPSAGGPGWPCPVGCCTAVPPGQPRRLLCLPGAACPPPRGHGLRHPGAWGGRAFAHQPARLGALGTLVAQPQGFSGVGASRGCTRTEGRTPGPVTCHLPGLASSSGCGWHPCPAHGPGVCPGLQDRACARPAWWRINTPLPAH